MSWVLRGPLVMITSTNVQLNEERCPVPDDLFGQLRRASPQKTVEIAKSLREPQRAQLAAFCYKRCHLHALGLMIASTCGSNALVAAAGASGRMIYAQSRDPEKTLSLGVRKRAYYEPKPVSLAPVTKEDR